MPGLTRAQELRTKRGTLAEQAKTILTVANAREEAQRGLTPEESATIDRIHAEIKTLGEEARTLEADQDRLARQDEIERELRVREPVQAGRPNTAGQPAPGVTRSEAIRSWMLGGVDGMTPEERTVAGVGMVSRSDAQVNPELAPFLGQGALRVRLSPLPANPDERRVWNRELMRYEYRGTNPQSTTTTAGGYTVPDTPMAGLEDALLAFGGMRAARTTILRTATGASLPIPTQNDTTNKGSILAENTTTTTVTQLTFGQAVLGAFKYSSDIVKASYEFLQDTAIDAEGFIARHLGERIGRITNDHFTFGSNSSQPYGVMWAAAFGKTAASATAIAYGEMVDLKHGVDPSYRTAAEWMLNDSTVGALTKVTDSYGQPMWMPGLALRVPDTILGHTFVVNQSMDSVAAGNHSVLFGDFSKYYIRDVMDVMVLRLVERGADAAQVWFLAFSRHDGDLVDAGTNPIKYLRHPAS